MMKINSKALLEDIDDSPKFLLDDENVDRFDINGQSHYRKKLENERYNSDTHAREWLANWSATVVSIWLFFVFLILIKNHSCFKLSDSVLNVLLGTTTLNVLGLSFIVLRGHFQSSVKG